MPCRVVIADDHAGVRGLARIALEEAGIEVVAEACDGAEAIAAVLLHAPDVLLLDLSMPVVDGLGVLAHLRSQSLRTSVVIFSSHSRERLAPLLLELGALTYVEKGARPPVLSRAVLDACVA